MSFFGVGEPAASAIAGRFSGLRAAWLVVDCFFLCVFSYSTAPPDCSLTRQSETAGRDLSVWDSGAEPFRLQKTAVHTSPADAGFV